MENHDKNVYQKLVPYPFLNFGKKPKIAIA